VQLITDAGNGDRDKAICIPSSEDLPDRLGNVIELTISIQAERALNLKDLGNCIAMPSERENGVAATTRILSLVTLARGGL
jgi:hypothetical protein